MKHGTYKIVTNQGLIEKTGYLFSCLGLDFGICKTHDWEPNSHWEVTELSTGRIMCGCSKRREAVEKVTQVVNKIGMDKVQKTLSEYKLTH